MSQNRRRKQRAGPEMGLGVFAGGPAFETPVCTEVNINREEFSRVVAFTSVVESVLPRVPRDPLRVTEEVLGVIRGAVLEEARGYPQLTGTFSVSRCQCCDRITLSYQSGDPAWDVFSAEFAMPAAGGPDVVTYALTFPACVFPDDVIVAALSDQQGV